MKNFIIMILTVVLIGVLSLLVFQKGIGVATVYHYGVVSDSSVPNQFETVELTIDTIDEDKNEKEYTFTIETKDFTGPYVKLRILRNKVINYEFIDKEDVPDKLIDKLESLN